MSEISQYDAGGSNSSAVCRGSDSIKIAVSKHKQGQAACIVRYKKRFAIGKTLQSLKRKTEKIAEYGAIAKMCPAAHTELAISIMYNLLKYISHPLE